MFTCAITCLAVAMLSAIASFSGRLGAGESATALHIYFIMVGLFTLSAMAAIVDFTPWRRSTRNRKTDEAAFPLGLAEDDPHADHPADPHLWAPVPASRK